MSIGAVQIASAAAAATTTAVRHVLSPIVDRVCHSVRVTALLSTGDDSRHVFVRAGVFSDLIRDEERKQHQEEDDYGEAYEISVVHKVGQ